MAEDGAIRAVYQPVETPTADYPVRTEWNVRDSDATVIFAMGELEGGSLLTAEMAGRCGRSWLHVDLGAISEEDAARRVAAWLADLSGDVVLNVAGQRESKSPGIGEAVRRVTSAVLRDLLARDGPCRGTPRCRKREPRAGRHRIGMHLQMAFVVAGVAERSTLWGQDG